MNWRLCVPVPVSGHKLGHTTPRVFTPPLRELTPETSLGFTAIDFCENILGIQLRPWQKFALIHGLELDMRTVPGHPEFDPSTPKHRYHDFRFKQVVVLVARQNGKTVLMTGLGLWRLFVEGAVEILSCAQKLSVADSTLDTAFNWACSVPVLREKLEHRNIRGRLSPYMRTTNGSRQMKLGVRPHYMEEIADIDRLAFPKWYTTAGTGGARSASIDLLLLDEVRTYKNREFWASTAPTVRERPRSQIWAFSNAGDKSSVVLRELRDAALSAIDAGDTAREKMCLMEWSAAPERDITDEEGWLEANPSLGYGVATLEDMAAMARAVLAGSATSPDGRVDDSVFRTEYLCQWVDVLEPGKFTRSVWDNIADPVNDFSPGTEVFVGVDCSLEAKSTSISVAFVRSDGRVHVECVAHRAGYLWVADWLNARRGAWFGGRVGVQSAGNSPATVLVPILQEQGIEVEEWRGAAATGAVIGFTAAIRDGLVSQPGRGSAGVPTLLEVAALGVRDKKLGDVALWDREKSSADVSPFIAANIAWWLATRHEEKFTSAYDGDYEPMIL